MKGLTLPQIIGGVITFAIFFGIACYLIPFVLPLFLPIIVTIIVVGVGDWILKLAWDLPTGTWSWPASIGWILFSCLEMVAAIVLLFMHTIAGKPLYYLWISLCIYIVFSVLILRGRYKKLMSKRAKENVPYVDDEPNDDFNEEFVDTDEDSASAKLCARLKHGMTVDPEFWSEMHLTFKCNLVPAYEALRLNFEIKNNSGVPWYNGGGGITLKANFYDKNGDLIHVDDTFIEDEVLVNNRFSDYLYFEYDEISEAVSVELYAYQEE